MDPRLPLLALQLDRQVSGTVLIYQGPPEWNRQVDAEEPPPAGRLVDDADRLLGTLPFEPARSRYVAAQVRAMRAVARQSAGELFSGPGRRIRCR
ncbi:hypothetical protein [Nocardia puris]|uniref:Uncharacterized protein n=1 Tax=Nocardia puris TaxID=208602 RepID=A0A366DU79_9NOCA|nr:hypothetical protein [Nocardia puris]RBO93646.1 hypothetical protein DFR74_10262 [Nocardia puris]